MAKTAIFNMRIDPEIKAEAEDLFAEFGLTLSDAVNIFLYKALQEQDLPFELKRTQKDMEQSEEIDSA